jgi:hypothetical protein
MVAVGKIQRVDGHALSELQRIALVDLHMGFRFSIDGRTERGLILKKLLYVRPTQMKSGRIFTLPYLTAKGKKLAAKIFEAEMCKIAGDRAHSSGFSIIGIDHSSGSDLGVLHVHHAGKLLASIPIDRARDGDAHSRGRSGRPSDTDSSSCGNAGPLGCSVNGNAGSAPAAAIPAGITGRIHQEEPQHPLADPDLGRIERGHVCKHGIRWPHPCDQCDALAWALEKARRG